MTTQAENPKEAQGRDREVILLKSLARSIALAFPEVIPGKGCADGLARYVALKSKDRRS